MLAKSALLLVAAAIASAHDGHEHQEPIAGPHKSLWYNRLPGDGGTQVMPDMISSVSVERRDR